MHKGRLEAFSDAVIAIILTIMVLELRPPDAATLEALRPLAPVFASYVLSFVFLAIYWNNHHHMMQSVQHVSGSALWANMLLLFSLSLTPFVTAWLGQSGIVALPVAAYGAVLLLAAISYYLLTLALISANGKDSPLAAALGKDFKGKISIAAYVTAIAFAAFLPAVSCAIYIGVALLWFVPDKRFEGIGK